MLVRKQVLSLKSYPIIPDPAGFTALDWNTSHYFPNNAFVEELRESIDHESINWYPYSPTKELKAKVGRFVGASSKNVVIGGGSIELLDTAVRIVTGRGYAIRLIDPYYSQFDRIAARSGARIVGASGFDTLGKSKARVFIVCNPNNPDGLVAPRGLVADLCGKNPDSLVICDEAYISYSDEPSATRLVNKHPNMLVTRSASKWGVAGARAGIAIAHPDLASALEKAMLPFTATALAQKALELCVTKYRKDMIGAFWKVKMERERIKSECADANLTDSQGNFNTIVGNSKRVYDAFRKNQLVVRKYPGLVRVDVATPDINDRVIKVLKSMR
ncbi:histidinol-phosphate aminotransferase family protein [Candidatus Micrarchaeota archaeon]|nr:histidinol-phosphate aminotransferase family protein [Candidatus Micrarchaeota archaeon]